MSKKRAPGRSLDEWMELVTECRQSGLTDAAWCNEHGISPSCFYNAVTRLRKKACQIPDPVGKASTLDLTSHKQDVVQIAIEPESSPAGLIPDNGNRPMHLDNSHSLSIIVWRYNVSEHGRSGDAVAVCCFVSDRMVFRIDVDAGFDPSFSPDKEDTICAEQSFHSGCLYDLCRNYCLYFTYFY